MQIRSVMYKRTAMTCGVQALQEWGDHLPEHRLQQPQQLRVQLPALCRQLRSGVGRGTGSHAARAQPKCLQEALLPVRYEFLRISCKVLLDKCQSQ